MPFRQLVEQELGLFTFNVGLMAVANPHFALVPYVSILTSLLCKNPNFGMTNEIKNALENFRTELFCSDETNQIRLESFTLNCLGKQFRRAIALRTIFGKCLDSSLSEPVSPALVIINSRT